MATGDSAWLEELRRDPSARAPQTGSAERSAVRWEQGETLLVVGSGLRVQLGAMKGHGPNGKTLM